MLITDRRGRILVQHVDYRTTCLLPGGAVDPNESPAQGAARELREELGVTTTVDRGLAVDWVSADSLNAPANTRFPGEILHVYDGGTWDNEQIAAILYAAPLTRLGPPSADPATGRTHIRILATPEQALELFDWGLPAADQLAAVHQARTRLGIPRAARQPLTELPDATDLTTL
ncbi:NUDIX domain-containing protein [Streptomyces sp. NPDC093586]|uniref:NUDIX domain-containing protein n=1 Tax=Streptomyces sp. NPDC093586 TaxID=3366042 RepID=UPI00382966E0